MAEIVKNILERESKYKTTEVVKDLELEIDDGNLLGSDSNPLDVKSLR